MTYTFVFPNGNTPPLSQPQRAALRRIADRHGFAATVTVHPMFGCDGGVMVHTGTMWIGVEEDGYAHT